MSEHPCLSMKTQLLDLSLTSNKALKATGYINGPQQTNHHQQEILLLKPLLVSKDRKQATQISINEKLINLSEFYAAIKRNRKSLHMLSHTYLENISLTQIKGKLEVGMCVAVIYHRVRKWWLREASSKSIPVNSEGTLESNDHQLKIIMNEWM